jgi:hypothetical protein
VLVPGLDFSKNKCKSICCIAVNQSSGSTQTDASSPDWRTLGCAVLECRSMTCYAGVLFCLSLIMVASAAHHKHVPTALRTARSQTAPFPSSTASLPEVGEDSDAQAECCCGHTDKR